MDVAETYGAELWAMLKEKERFILQKRLSGLDGRAMTLRQLSELMGMSREGIRAIELRARRKLRYFAQGEFGGGGTGG